MRHCVLPGDYFLNENFSFYTFSCARYILVLVRCANIIVDEKNDPDLIPHDNSDDEKEFERLYTPTKLNYVNRHSPNSISPSLRFSEKQVSVGLHLYLLWSWDVV